MKKLLISATILVREDTINSKSVMDSLQWMGDTLECKIDQVQLAHAESKKNYQWFFAGSDPDQAFLEVEGKGQRTGRELSDNEMANIRFHGVCTSFYGEYPRADLFGTPGYATDHLHAEALVAAYRVPVAAEGMEVDSLDRGSNAPQDLWFEIAT